MNRNLFDKVSLECSKITTLQYSTSFSLGIRLLSKALRSPIYAIYGFVRFADEIVDTFHTHNKELLLSEFSAETYKAINAGISLNPILNSFQKVVNQYQIDIELIDCFLESMKMDLNKHSYNKQLYEKYILGSAEVVGLMCLKVFVNGNQAKYIVLKPYAMALGSAFQKINFLRDLGNDYYHLGRIYFPDLNLSQFNNEAKRQIEEDIQKDFEKGLQGIKMLPSTSRLGVYLAYIYYYTLFTKIKHLQPADILNHRIRVPNSQKAFLLIQSYFKNQFNLI